MLVRVTAVSAPPSSPGWLLPLGSWYLRLKVVMAVQGLGLCWGGPERRGGGKERRAERCGESDSEGGTDSHSPYPGQGHRPGGWTVAWGRLWQVGLAWRLPSPPGPTRDPCVVRRQWYLGSHLPAWTENTSATAGRD